MHRTDWLVNILTSKKVYTYGRHINVKAKQKSRARPVHITNKKEENINKSSPKSNKYVLIVINDPPTYLKGIINLTKYRKNK